MKRSILFLLIAILLLAGSTSAFADDGTDCLASGTEGSVNWLLTVSGTLTVSGSGPMPDYTPGAFAPWYELRTNITAIVIENGVTSVGDYAFLNCDLAASAALPGGISKIGIQAFANCSSLSALIVPEAVTAVGAYAFANCVSLRSVEFTGNAPTIGAEAFSGVTAAVYGSCLKSGWSEEITASYGGSLAWSIHSLDEGVILEEADCFQDGMRERKCFSCGITVREPILSTGHASEHFAAKEPGCTEKGCGEYWYCSLCGCCYSDSALMDEIQLEDIWIPALGHETVVDEEIPATPEQPGKTKGEHCSRCGEILIPQEEIPALGYVASFRELPIGTSVTVNGAAFTVREDRTIRFDWQCNGPAIAAIYHDGSAQQSFTNYPTAVKVYAIPWDGEGRAVAVEISDLSSSLRYRGVSIRTVGENGIRLVTGVSQSAVSSLLTGAGGFTLTECGTLAAYRKSFTGELLLSTPGATKSVACSGDSWQLQLSEDGDELLFYGELTDIPDDRCTEEIVLRSYLKITDASGRDTVIYGGEVTRSIGYVAWQNRNSYDSGTENYSRIWEYVHAQYGNKYDDEYHAENG